MNKNSNRINLVLFQQCICVFLYWICFKNCSLIEITYRNFLPVQFSSLSFEVCCQQCKLQVVECLKFWRKFYCQLLHVARKPTTNNLEKHFLNGISKWRKQCTEGKKRIIKTTRTKTQRECDNTHYAALFVICTYRKLMFKTEEKKNLCILYTTIFALYKIYTHIFFYIWIYVCMCVYIMQQSKKEFYNSSFFYFSLATFKIIKKF